MNKRNNSATQISSSHINMLFSQITKNGLTRVCFYSSQSFIPATPVLNMSTLNILYKFNKLKHVIESVFLNILKLSVFNLSNLKPISNSQHLELSWIITQSIRQLQRCISLRVSVIHIHYVLQKKLDQFHQTLGCCSM